MQVSGSEQGLLGLLNRDFYVLFSPLQTAAEHGNKAAVAPAELAAGNLLNLLLAITLNSNISWNAVRWQLNHNKIAKYFWTTDLNLFTPEQQGDQQDLIWTDCLLTELLWHQVSEQYEYKLIAMLTEHLNLYDSELIASMYTFKKAAELNEGVGAESPSDCHYDENLFKFWKLLIFSNCLFKRPNYLHLLHYNSVKSSS